MANQITTNKILADYFESVLTTNVNFDSYVTVDTSMQEQAGMTKTVYKRSVTGDVEDVTEGNGCSGAIETTRTSTDYTVTTTQGKGAYSDEEEMKDGNVKEDLLKGLAEKMANKCVAKTVAELAKGTLAVAFDASKIFDNFVDAVALFKENTEAKYAFLNAKTLAKVRKNLKDALVYRTDIVLNGYVGSVCGVDLVATEAMADDKIYIATKSAVTLFMKKGSVVETDRNIDTRKNTLVARKVMLYALTDANKVVKIDVTPVQG